MILTNRISKAPHPAFMMSALAGVFEMNWKKPNVAELALGAEINSYASADR